MEIDLYVPMPLIAFRTEILCELFGTLGWDWYRHKGSHENIGINRIASD